MPNRLTDPYNILAILVSSTGQNSKMNVRTEDEICSLETHDGTHKNSLGTNIGTQNGALGTNLFSD